MGVRMLQWMEKMSKQRGMGCAGRHHPPGRADEAGRLVRDKLRKRPECRPKITWAKR